MTKALSFLLVLSMLMAMSSGTLAVDGSHSKEEIRVVDNTGRGQYTISKGVKALLGIDGGVVATATDIDDTIYYIENKTATWSRSSPTTIFSQNALILQAPMSSII